MIDLIINVDMTKNGDVNLNFSTVTKEELQARASSLKQLSENI